MTDRSNSYIFGAYEEEINSREEFPKIIILSKESKLAILKEVEQGVSQTRFAEE